MRETSSVRRSVGLRAALVALGLCAIACNSKESQPQADKAKVSAEKEEVPEGFVLNPFLPSEGGAGSKAAAAAGSAAPAPGEAAAAAEESTAIKLLSAGEEPRSVQRYTLASGKSEKRKGTVSMSGDGPMAQPPVRLAFSLTPGKKSAEGTEVLVQFTQFEFAPERAEDKAMAAEANQTLALAVGMSANLSVKPDGSTGQATIAPPQNLAQRGGLEVAAQLAPLLQPALELLYVPLPKEPIGKGAKWQQVVEQREGHISVSVTTEFELLDIKGDVLEIKGKIVRQAPKQPMQEPPGATFEIDGKGNYTWSVSKLFGARRAKGESETKITQTLPGKPPQQQILKTREQLDPG